MHGYIFYKNEILWKNNSTKFDILAKKLLSIANQKQIDPYSTLYQFIQEIGIYTGGIVNKELNSREEIMQLATLLELVINELIEQGYYNSYNYLQNGVVKNLVFDEDQHFLKRLKEIATKEWKDENLFINRADTIEDLAPTLLYFAEKEKYNTQLPIMDFLRKLLKKEVKDIEIFSKIELDQFIKVLELAIQSLILSNYFEKYSFNQNGITFNYVLHNYLIFLERLKEISANWDSVISPQWKKGELLTKTKSNLKFENRSKTSQNSKPNSFLKKLIILLGRASLILTFILAILWVLILMLNSSNFLN